MPDPGEPSPFEGMDKPGEEKIPADISVHLQTHLLHFLFFQENRLLISAYNESHGV